MCSGLRGCVNSPSETKEVADKIHCSSSALQVEDVESSERIAEGPVEIGSSRLEKVLYLFRSCRYIYDIDLLQ